jgi:hypothetical protein
VSALDRFKTVHLADHIALVLMDAEAKCSVGQFVGRVAADGSLCLTRTGLSPVGSLLAPWRTVWWTSRLQMQVTLSNGRLLRWPPFAKGSLSGSWDRMRLFWPTEAITAP